MNNTEKIKHIDRVIKNFGEKALIYLQHNPEQKIEPYLFNIVFSSLYASNYIIKEDSEKATLLQSIYKRWDKFKQTPKGSELIDFYKEEPARKELVKNPSIENVTLYLNNLSNKKTFVYLFEEFINSHNMPIVQEMIERPVNAKQKITIDIETCILAVKANSTEIMDYLIDKSKYIKKSSDTYYSILAKTALEEDKPDMLRHILSKGLNPETSCYYLLSYAVTANSREMQCLLVDHGAIPKGDELRKSNVSKETDIQWIEKYYHSKKLNDSLDDDLKTKSENKKLKL